MKTKITATLLLITGSICSATAQNNWQPAPAASNYVKTESPALVSRTETYFGAEFEFTEAGGKITNIIANSPAEANGFRKGDLVTHIGTFAINSKDNYTKAMEAYRPGERVDILYIRKGNAKERKVDLDKITVFKNAGL
jgi:predicted metalloprotease with PDZ domain